VSELSVRRTGSGPTVVLLHGGVGPEVGWELQEPLAESYELVIPWRRGYGESPATDLQDFEQDARDLLALLDEPTHVAAFSYGGLGALIAAGRQPERFRSLTLIEPALLGLAEGDPDVQALMEQLAQFAQAGPAGAPPELQGFMALQAVAIERGFPPPPRIRPPFEAQPQLEPIASAGVPVLVVSGDHHPGFERICDAVAERLGAERAVLPGAGHGVQRADGFNERFEAFLVAS
jgi:pimeloyl-ACP methyl ester carboxylesterase